MIDNSPLLFEVNKLIARSTTQRQLLEARFQEMNKHTSNENDGNIVPENSSASSKVVDNIPGDDDNYWIRHNEADDFHDIYRRYTC